MGNVGLHSKGFTNFFRDQSWVHNEQSEIEPVRWGTERLVGHCKLHMLRCLLSRGGLEMSISGCGPSAKSSSASLRSAMYGNADQICSG